MSDDVNVKFGASTEEFNAKAQEASAVFGKSMDDIARSVAESHANIAAARTKFLAEYEQETERLVEEERAANESAYALAHANDAVAESADKATHATVGTKREMMVLGHEIMSGNMSRVPGSFMVLMERTGGLSGAITALGGAMMSPIGIAVILTAGAVALAVAFEKTAKAADEMNNAILLTGNYAGKTSQDIRDVSESIAINGNISIGTAKEIEQALVQSGRVGSDAWNDISLAVANYSQVSGKTAEESANYMAKIFSDPSKGARELDSTLHFLTQSDLDYIDTLDRNGSVSEAAEFAAKKLNARYAELSDTTGVLTKIMMGFSSVMDRLGMTMQRAFNPTDVDRLHTAMTAVAKDLQHVQELGDKAAAASGWKKRLADDEANAAQLSAKVTSAAEKEKAQAAQTAAAEQEKALNKLADSYAPNIKKADDLRAAIDRLNAAMSKPGIDHASEEYKKYADAVKNAKTELANLHDVKAHKAPVAKSDMPEWKSELDQMHDAEGAFFSKSLEEDEKFWAAKVAHAQKGTKDYIGAEHELATIHKQLAVQQFNTVIDELRNEEAATKAGSQERVTIAQKIADQVGSAYGKESTQYITAYRAVITASKEFQAEQKKQAQLSVESARNSALAEVDIQHEKLVELKNSEQITAQQEIQAFQQLEDKKYQIALEAQQKLIALDGSNQDELQKDLAAQTKLIEKHNIEVSKLQANLSKAIADDWNKMLSPMTIAFDSSIKGMIMGTTTMQKAMQNITQSILGEFLNLGMQMVKNWAVSELTKTTLTKEGTVTRSILEAMGLVKSQAAQVAASTSTIAAKKVEAAGVIPAEAATAAGGAAASVASIPYVGPAMAAAAYAETMGIVMGGMAVASSAGGEWNVPGDRLNFVHQNETILPAHIATPLRAMVESGGGVGGDIHLHVNAVDSKDVARLFKDNGHHLAAALKQQVRNFNTGR